jgi:hypothetical protein
MRLASTKAATVELASTPTLFGEIRQPNSPRYLAIPKVSSERRNFIPIGYLDASVVCGDKIFFVSDANLFTFGILNSTMHNAWMRYTCGRLKSDYSYSNTIVYNNYPWPDEPSDKQRAAIEAAAQAVLDARAQFPQSSLADLYDPLTMPPATAKPPSPATRSAWNSCSSSISNSPACCPPRQVNPDAKRKRTRRNMTRENPLSIAMLA